jgi:hypothetical protein
MDLTASNGFHLAFDLNTFCGGQTPNSLFSYPEMIVANQIDEQGPTITLDPQPLVAQAHKQVTFTVTTTGTPPLSYQWSLNGTNISGATLSSLTIPNVAQDNLGTYSVVVTNAFGSVTSSSAMLSMYSFTT